MPPEPPGPVGDEQPQILEPVSAEAPSLAAEIAESVGQIEFRLSDESSKPRNDLRAVEADIAQCQVDIDRLQAELESARLIVEEKKGQRDATKRILEELSGQLRVLNELLALQLKEKEAKERVYDELDQAEKDAGEFEKSAKAEVERETGKLNNLSGDPREYTKQMEICGRLSDNLRRLQNDLRRITEQKGQAEGDKRITSADHRFAEQAASAKASEVENARQAHNDISDALQAAEEAFNQKEKDLGGANERFEGLKARASQLGEQLSGFTARGEVLKRLKGTTEIGQKAVDRMVELGNILFETRPAISEAGRTVFGGIEDVRTLLSQVEIGLTGRLAVMSSRVEDASQGVATRGLILRGLLRDIKTHASVLEEGDDEKSWTEIMGKLDLLKRLLAEEDEQTREQQRKFIVDDLSQGPPRLTEDGLAQIGAFDPAKVEPLKAALAAMEERAKGAEAARDRASTALAEKETLLTQVQARVAELEELERQSIEAVAQLQRAIAEANSERDAEKGKVGERDKSLAAAEEKLRGLEADLGRAQENLTNVNADLTTRTSERDGLAAEKTALEKDLAKKARELENLRETEGILRGQVREAGASVSEKSVAFAEAERRAERAEGEAATARDARDAAQAKAKELEEQVKRLKREAAELKPGSARVTLVGMSPPEPGAESPAGFDDDEKD